MDVLALSPYAGEFEHETFPRTLVEALAFIGKLFPEQTTDTASITLSRPIAFEEAEIPSVDTVELASWHFRCITGRWILSKADVKAGTLDGELLLLEEQLVAVLEEKRELKPLLCVGEAAKETTAAYEVNVPDVVGEILEAYVPAALLQRSKLHAQRLGYTILG